MKKFIVHHSRTGETSLMEVELEIISALEDSSVTWLPKGEYKARVLEPASLYEKSPEGPLIAPVWYSFAFHDSMQKASEAAEAEIRSSFERELRKLGKVYTEQQVQDKLSQVKEVNLP